MRRRVGTHESRVATHLQSEVAAVVALHQMPAGDRVRRAVEIRKNNRKWDRAPEQRSVSDREETDMAVGVDQVVLARNAAFDPQTGLRSGSDQR